jgi:hypothetical protein
MTDKTPKKSSAGKGDSVRKPRKWTTYWDNYDYIFRKKIKKKN